MLAPPACWRYGIVQQYPIRKAANSKQGGGAFGLLTDGLMTREGVYTQTLILALIPFVHELWK